MFHVKHGIGFRCDQVGTWNNDCRDDGKRRILIKTTADGKTAFADETERRRESDLASQNESRQR